MSRNKLIDKNAAQIKVMIGGVKEGHYITVYTANMFVVFDV